MKLSRIGRVSMALVVSVAMGLGMTACGGGTIGFMWVLGTQFNQIAAFKIDDFTGNLTTPPGSPFPSGGQNPVSLVVKPGGRYLYVVNQGSALPTDPSGGASCGTTPGGGGLIAEYSIGGQGVLVFQQSFQSQGCTPVWAAHDSTGNFLYVLDKYAPNTACLPNGQPEPSSSQHPVPLACNGEITVFSVDPNTGRLTLVLNQQIKDPTTGLQITYFPVGALPRMLATSGSCVFTLNSDANQTVFPYLAGTSGQLALTTNSTINSGAVRATSIIAGGTAIYITDAGQPNTNSPGQVLPFTVGTTCSLNTITGGPTQNLSPGANPAYALVDSKSQYLYIANQSSTNSTTANSSISAFKILSNGTLQVIPDNAGLNPYPVGGGPVCMVEDPSNQYLYTSNGDGTVTGKVLFAPTGQLSNLPRGSTFTAVGQATCLATSGNVD